MFRSIQWRITSWFVLLILVSMSILGAWLTNFIRNDELESLRSQLGNEAKITAVASLATFIAQDKPENLNLLAQEAGSQIGARVTIIAPDGTILGDSLENPAVMENHANRPEVKDALASGYGESTRYSTTLGQRMMYVAVPVMDNGSILGIARVALPLTKVNSAVNRVIIGIIISMAITTLLIILAAWLIARIMTRPIRELTRASRVIAEGKFGERISVGTKDEAGELARAFNNMSLNLKTTITTLSEEKARLAAILDNMADGIIMTDAEGKVMLTNHAAEKLLGVSDEDMKGKNLVETVHDYELNEILKSCLKNACESAAQFDASASNHFLRAIAIPVNGEQPGGALILLQDLTELKDLQTMRRQLVGNISHEFRTPLAGIKAMVETLQDGAMDDPPAARDFLDRIEAEVDRLTQLVAELAELSRIETGREKLAREILDINLLAEDVISQLKPQADRQNLSFEQELSANIPSIPADRERIRQVLVNLIHNAIKFNTPGGRIKVSTRVSGNKVVVEIANTGEGIAKKDIPHIFERFYKVDKSRGGQGSGMGLAIARHVVEEHGGEISVQSEEGRGTTFIFSLPTAVSTSQSNEI